MNEQWQAVVGYEGIYEVSDRGRVRSLDRIDASGHRRRGRIRALQIAKRGQYVVVTLSRDGQKRAHKVHQLVALAFLGLAPPGTEVNHCDGNKAANVPGNLEYLTHAENIRHAARTGLARPARGERNGRAKLTSTQVAEIRLLRQGGVRTALLAERFGVSRSMVCRILRGEGWVT